MSNKKSLQAVDSDIHYCYNRIGRSSEMIERLIADTTDSKVYGEWLVSAEQKPVNQIILREKNRVKYWTKELTRLIKRREELTL